MQQGASKKVQYWGDGIICEVFSATGKVKIQCTS